MERENALDCLVREGVFMVSPEHAQDVARAFEVTLDQIGIEPTQADVLAVAPLSLAGQGNQPGSVRIKHGDAHKRAVFMYQLAATLALHFGLYANIDHALQSPYHKAQSECRYIACRAAIRLARYFGGTSAVTALRERNPWLEQRLLSERPYTGTGVILRMRG